MSLFSVDRLSHLSHLLTDELEESGAVDLKDHANALKKVKSTFEALTLKMALAIEVAEKKVQSVKKNLVPGTAEYMDQVERFFLDEIHKKHP